ncbi:hypothetical protein F5Y08DRAFT_296852 [Xylaria arbuscula]|nr:hypothetical protein F5Y08DRAFT_296852 [Xylaria arbuscula]
MATSAHKWDDQTHCHLFLSIIEALDLSFSKENKDDIVKVMNERYGHDVNWNGIRQHLQKLKKKEANGPPSMPSTPRKPKAAGVKTPKTPKSTGKKRKHEEPQDRDEDEDEEKILKKKVKHEHRDAPLNLDRFLKAETSTSEDGVIP